MAFAVPGQALQLVQYDATCYHPYTCTASPDKVTAGPSLFEGFAGQQASVTYDPSIAGYRSRWYVYRIFASFTIPAGVHVDALRLTVAANLKTSGQERPSLIAFAAPGPAFSTSSYPRAVLGSGSGIFGADLPPEFYSLFDTVGGGPKTVWIALTTDREAGGLIPPSTSNTGSLEYYEGIQAPVLAVTSRESAQAHDTVGLSDGVVVGGHLRASVHDTTVRLTDLAHPTRGHRGRDHAGARDEVHVTRTVKVEDTIGAQDFAYEIAPEERLLLRTISLRMPSRRARIKIVRNIGSVTET